MITTFLIALLFHLLYDFHWQGDFIAKNKGKSWVIMTVHCLTWTLGLCLLVSVNQAIRWYVPICLFAGHYAMDLWKVWKVEEYEDALNEKYLKLEAENNAHAYALEWSIDEDAKTRYFNKLLLIDQVFHFAQIVILVFSSGQFYETIHISGL